LVVEDLITSRRTSDRLFLLDCTRIPSVEFRWCMTRTIFIYPDLDTKKRVLSFGEIVSDLFPFRLERVDGPFGPSQLFAKVKNSSSSALALIPNSRTESSRVISPPFPPASLPRPHFPSFPAPSQQEVFSPSVIF